MEELIAKKELLALTGISYGQLYRWKRKNIIPEEWFIKKSVPSGQETFFPKEKILERIDVIVNMKDEASLDDLAKMFSSEPTSISLDLEKLLSSRLLCEESIALYKQATEQKEITTIEQFLGVKLFKNHVMTSHITLEEGKLIDAFLSKHYEKVAGESGRIYLVRQMGIPLIIGAKDNNQIILDSNYKVVLEYNIYEEVSTIKFQMM
ncbi:MAG: DUF4004 family protein [Cellulosilyticaceae bacterium]